MIKKRAFILAFLGIILSIIAYLLSELSQRYNLVIFLGGLFRDEVTALLAIGAIICFNIVLHMIFKYLREKYLNFKVLVIIGSLFVKATSVVLCLIMIFVGLLDESSTLVLKSPDKEHTIVIVQSSFFHHFSGSIYEKVNPLFLIQIGGLTVDDGYRPFTNDDYTVEWFDDGLRIKYLSEYPQKYYEKRLYYIKEDFDNYIEGAGD